MNPLLIAAVAIPLLGGLALWTGGGTWSRARLALTSGALVGLMGAVVVAAVVTGGQTRIAWGNGLELVLAIEGPVAVMLTVVTVITAAVVVYAAGHEPVEGLARLLGLLITFAGAMVLLVLAADLLTLMIGFELTAAASWGLIAHDWRDPDAAPAAAHAFNATRIGSLGLLAAAGAALAGTGSLQFADLSTLNGWPAQVFAAGMLVAAAAKSAQVPFSPWLTSAMAGPTPASALLHSATMVAAGAWALIRLAEPLSTVGWFGPAAIVLGLLTALSGGISAALQPRAKHLLAASTSAQYGLMIAAVGAGVAGAAMVHLVAHAVVKALLFLVAGVALSATGSPYLSDHGLWRLRRVAIPAWIGALGLAAVPPLAAAWSKEQVIAALGHAAPAWAVIGAIAGGLSAVYALRFAWLGFGPPSTAEEPDRVGANAVGTTETWAIGGLAVIALLGGVFWVIPHDTAARVTGLRLIEGQPWELALSLGLLVVAALGVLRAARRGRLARPDESVLADWWGLPTVLRRAVVDPGLALSARAAAFDTRAVDRGVDLVAAGTAALSRWWGRMADLGVDDLVGGLSRLTITTAAVSVGTDDRAMDGTVEALASGVGDAGRDVRRSHTGMAQHYYAIVIAGLGLTILLLVLLR
ncbi:MAG: proton-conducting transporter membrane subunit [Euzebya sp.]